MEPTTQTCPNCGKEVPGGARLCPNCGAALTAAPPLPVLGNKPVPQTTDEVLWTRSRKGDIAIGIVLGIIAPLIIPFILTGLYFLTPSSTSGMLIGLLSMLGQVVLPFLAAFFLKRKYPVVGGTMLKTLLFWILLGVLIVLGVLAICLVGGFKI